MFKSHCLAAACLSAFVLAPLAASSAARADSSCLPTATNAELMAELTRRLDQGPGPTTSTANVLATCVWDGSGLYNLQVNVTSDSGATDTATIDLGGACATVRDLINPKLSQISTSKIIAGCTWDGSGLYNLTRLQVTPAGKINALQVSDVGGACNDQAAAINNQL